MARHPFFRLSDEVGRDPRRPVGPRPRVFPNTGALELDDVERHWARWEGGALGGSGVSVWRVRSTGHAIDLVSADRWSYHLPLRGGMGLTFRREEAVVREGNGALVGPARRRTRVVATAGGLFDSLVLLVDPGRAGLPDDANAGRTGLVTATDRGALSSYLRFLASELARDRSTIHAPAALGAAGALASELYRATALAGDGGASTPAAGADHVRRAEEIMRARLGEPLKIADIARAVGVGTRALQMAFAAHLGATPREVLAEMRLDAAHRDLLSASPDETVTDVALVCGFAHLSRFAAAYRRRFGERPSETLARARRAHYPAA
ncbi:MAG: helix-turn-helix transcriptional regulator [Paracoccaceae bacterium]|jgi:AraC-like DNA-binding protein|nr:helix-turn-helix transcriptional regulator [Paracoccaceae bacterium]